MRAREDDVEAIAELFAQHARRLADALAAAGYADAHDAVQEAFAQALIHWRKVSRYEQRIGWIRHVAINRARNRERGRRRQRAVAERLAQERTSPSQTSLEHRDDDLTDAIAALPERQRLALALYYYADLPVADVAAAMGLTPGAARYHLHAARTNLAASLEVNNGI